MNVVQSSSSIGGGILRRKQQISSADVDKNKSQKYQINLYEEPPTAEISIDDFEIYGLKRLKVLRKIEQIKSMRIGSIDAATASRMINDAIFSGKKNDVNLNNPEIDHVSHYILRAAYSMSEEKRRWFLLHEAELFKHRMEPTIKSSRSQFSNALLQKHCDLHPITNEEKNEFREQIMNGSKITKPAEFMNAIIYKVPFHQALYLISKRKCFVRKGYAYIPLEHAVDILVSKFRMHLSKCLAIAATTGIMSDKNSNHAVEDERLNPLLENLHSCMDGSNQYDPDQYSTDTDITHASIPSVVPHMPLCMRQLQNGLKKDAKLRYYGRLQYGLFLKAIGLSMEESLIFFKKMFSNMTSEQFDKQYSYNIRHIYGKEGKRESKSAYGCMKIIMGLPGPSHSQDHHGCPYKHYDANHVTKLLGNMQLSEKKEIVDLAKTNQYQLACLKHFEYTHPKNAEVVNLDNVGNHPNAWFRASIEYHNSIEKNGKNSTLIKDN